MARKLIITFLATLFVFLKTSCMVDIPISNFWFILCPHSGLLVAYLSLRHMEKKNGQLPLFNYYFHRFWRFALFVLFVSLS